MPESYSPCPCGSGKKFKWCCQPIYVGINRAWEQEANGQHEAALRLLDEVTREHPGNPEAWGQKAKMLYGHGRAEDAEEALQKAFAINPNYPYGLLLRSVFRLHEGETAGALLLARRAAEAFDPSAHDYLAEACFIIFECELKLNRPVAARAALRLVTHYLPGNEESREAFENTFGPNSRLPEATRRDYTFLGPPPGTAGPAKAGWDRALASVAGLRLSDLVRLFEQLTKELPEVPAAWFNLGLSQAWLGDNRAALDALERYLGLETDAGRAVLAATLAEVLRCGAGLEDECDYSEHLFSLQLRNPEPLGALLQEWGQTGRLLPLPTQQEGLFFALVLELTSTALLTVGSPATDAGRMAGYLALVGPVVQFTSPRKEAYERVRDEFRQRLALALGELHERRGPVQWQDVVAEALLFPLTKRDDNAERVRTHVQKYYEETWLHQPRRSLAGNSPVDAAAHPKLRHKLAGVVQFIQDCARGGIIGTYDFDRLRRKLGLAGAPSGEPDHGASRCAGGAPTGGASPVAHSPAQRDPYGSGSPLDIPAMGTAELAGLSVEGLTFEQLEQAYQAAQKLDAEELADHFARALVSRPPQPERPDRFAWYSYLSQRALKAGDTDAALELVNDGEKADCEHNEGRRRNDYELRRGQVHARRGEVDAAEDVFRRLIERVPSNLRFRGAAAEAMLSLKQGGRALRFAEEGVAAARAANDRDFEQYLLELAAAARKQS
jgi:tetratricopeptide (TPR) repeat protein